MKTRDEILDNFVKMLKVAEDENMAPMTGEQYKDLMSGIYTTPQGESEWSPEGLKPNIQSGESEWEPSGEEEIKPDLGYKYHPDEKVYRGPRREEDPLKGRYSKKPNEEEKKPEVGKEKMSDQELLLKIEKEPEHLVTNLMIQRDPEYADFDTIHRLVKSLYNWMEKNKINPEEGSILYEESMYMLDLLNKKLDEKESEKSE